MQNGVLVCKMVCWCAKWCAGVQNGVLVCKMGNGTFKAYQTSPTVLWGAGPFILRVSVDYKAHGG